MAQHTDTATPTPDNAPDAPEDATTGTTPDTAAAEPTDGHDDGDHGDDHGGDHGDGSKAGREAARYRRQLRETEAERDALAARVEVMQRAEVERIAGDTLARPAAVWAAGTTLADVLDAEGNVDPAKVAEIVTHATDTLGLAKVSRAPRPDPSQGAQGHGDHGEAARWAEAMRF